MMIHSACVFDVTGSSSVVRLGFPLCLVPRHLPREGRGRDQNVSESVDVVLVRVIVRLAVEFNDELLASPKRRLSQTCYRVGRPLQTPPSALWTGEVPSSRGGGGTRTQQRPEYTMDGVSITPYPRIPLARMPGSDVTDHVEAGYTTKPGIVRDER